MCAYRQKIWNSVCFREEKKPGRKIYGPFESQEHTVDASVVVWYVMLGLLGADMTLSRVIVDDEYAAVESKFIFAWLIPHCVDMSRSSSVSWASMNWLNRVECRMVWCRLAWDDNWKHNTSSIHRITSLLSDGFRYILEGCFWLSLFMIRAGRGNKQKTLRISYMSIKQLLCRAEF